jgi:hypothetical protein
MSLWGSSRRRLVSVHSSHEICYILISLLPNKWIVGKVSGASVHVSFGL